jgi:hypothetical protein
MRLAHPLQPTTLTNVLVLSLLLPRLNLASSHSLSDGWKRVQEGRGWRGRSGMYIQGNGSPFGPSQDRNGRCEMAVVLTNGVRCSQMQLCCSRTMHHTGNWEGSVLYTAEPMTPVLASGRKDFKTRGRWRLVSLGLPEEERRGLRRLRLC